VTAARRAWIAVAIATVATLIARLVLARSVVSPFIFQDEGGYVGVARLLAGDAPSLYGPTYLPLWGVLLAPAAAALDPGALHTAAQVLNALVAAATIPVLHLLGRRVAGTPPWVSAAAAVAGGLTAASVLQATMLLPEALLALTVAAVVLALHAALGDRRVGPAVAAGALAGASYGVHPRAVVVVVAVVVVAVAAWRSGTLGARAAGALGGAAVVAAAASQVLHAWATSELYRSGTQPSLAGSPLGALGEPVGSAVIALGQSWYVVVASLGLVAVGFAAAAQLGWTQRSTPAGLAAGFVVLGVLGSLALGTIGSYEVGAGTSVGRADLPLYGRYLEQWTPVLVVLAPALARRWVRVVVPATGAAVVAAAIALHARYADEVWRGPMAWHNVAALRVPVEVFGRDHVVATGVAAAVALTAAGLVATAGTDRRWWVVPLGAVAAVNVASGTILVREWAAPASEAWAARHELGDLAGPAASTVWVDLDEDFHVHWAYNAQFWDPDLDIAYYEGPPPPQAALVAGSPSTPPEPGASLLATEPDGTIGLWDTAR